MLNAIGTLLQEGNNITQAETHHQQALELSRAIDRSWDEAHALECLGRCALATGVTDAGISRLREAWEIFNRIGAIEAADLATEISELAKGEQFPSGG